MRTFIKHFFSFLLIFGLAVTECSLFSQTNYSAPSQVSYIDDRVAASRKQSRFFVFKQWLSLFKSKTIASAAFLALQDVCSVQKQILLRLRTAIYQQIRATIAQVTFLSAKITTSIYYTPLYIA